jgi:uracil-DNA glycosylase
MPSPDIRWTERQSAMLREMGIRLWGACEKMSEVVAPTHQPAQPIKQLTTQPTAKPTKQAGEIVAGSSANLISSTSPNTHDQNYDAAHISTLDWAALRQAVTNCTACQLCRGRKQTVFGVGDKCAHWMIVGEAPGEQEDQQGEPFVGKSGQLLDNMLHALALSRLAAPTHHAPPPSATHQVYIANTLKCRPPGNRNPAAEELAKCEPYLMRQVQLVQPKIILAMGRFAVQSLLRSTEPIGRLRGRVHHYQGVPLIVTYHPAYLLRNPEDKAKAWDDLCLAQETLQLKMR